MRTHNTEQTKPVATQTIVVAKQPLRFGTELSAAMLQEVPWPSQSVPAGAFAKIGDVLAARPPRRADRDRAERAGARAQDHRRRPARDALGLGARRHEGRHHPRQRRRRRRRLRAAGRPRRRGADAPDREGLGDLRGRAAEHARAGDRPDRRRTRRQGRRSPSRSRSKSTTVQAQKVWLASSVGTLSLLLRKAGETAEAKTRKVTLKDLGSDESARHQRSQQRDGRGHARQRAKQAYTVPSEGNGGLGRHGKPEAGGPVATGFQTDKGAGVVS